VGTCEGMGPPGVRETARVEDALPFGRSFGLPAWAGRDREMRAREDGALREVEEVARVAADVAREAHGGHRARQQATADAPIAHVGDVDLELEFVAKSATDLGERRV